MGIGGAIIRYWGTYYYSLSSGKIDKFLFGYVHFHSVLLALAVFVFFKYNYQKLIVIDSKLLAHISSCSLGIYLVHKLVMNYELIILDIKPDNVYWRFLGPFLTYFVCLFIVLGIKRVPILKRIFP